jgi:iron complex transport system ATP-binding protein
MQTSRGSIVDFRNLDVVRAGRPALQDIQLRVPLGEHVAILGANGSGKSTLIHVITREIYPERNPTTVCRLFDAARWNIFGLRHRLGIVSNDLAGAFARRMSGLEVVLSGFFSSIGLWPANAVTPGMESQARHALQLMEAGHLAERSVTEVSSGEARRLLIARALVHDPEALLLDEPTNSLDFRAAHEFREALSSLARAGRTILLVTHTVADVIPEIERVVLLKNGRIIQDGARRSVLTTEHLSALFGMPLRVEERDGKVWVSG